MSRFEFNREITVAHSTVSNSSTDSRCNDCREIHISAPESSR